MSSQSHHKMSGMTSKPRTDEIELTEHFSEQMAQLCMKDDYSDVTFIVENQRLPAHRVILAARSEYFRALLFGGLSESKQSEIHLKYPLDAFKALLKYIYSGHMLLSQMDEDNILDTLGLTNQYGFTELELAISEYLRHYLALNNVCAILDAARLYNLDKLTKVCLTFMFAMLPTFSSTRNMYSVLQESLKNDTNNVIEIQRRGIYQVHSLQESLEEVLRRDSFFAPEVQISLAVSQWCKHHSNIDIESVVSYVRLPLMNLEDLLQVVRPSGILDPNKLLDAIEEQTASKHLPYRAALWPEENVATTKFNSRTIQGECRTALLDGDCSTYDMEKGYTRHCITDNNDSGITVKLGTICIVNHIKMLLFDRDNRTYSYFIEVSVNQTHWERVIDYSHYHCRSWQFLYFPARAVRYVRLVGTHNTVHKVFHVIGLEAMYTAQMPKVLNGIVAPTANVATIEMSASVVKGDNCNALLNGCVKYDQYSGYTSHQLESGEIVIRLGQPYIVGSMRLLLYEFGGTTYSFYIETSVNEKDWKLVVDKRNEQARSWQNFTFTPLPVVLIRIVGTRTTANEIFHCVHLECPSQDPTFLQAEKDKLRANSSNTSNALNVPANAASSSSSSASNNTNRSNNSVIARDLLIKLDNISV